MTKKFKRGQIVVLKSGGPRMTVDSIDSLENIWATWFSGSKHNRAAFKEDSLLTEEEARAAGLVK